MLKVFKRVLSLFISVSMLVQTAPETFIKAANLFGGGSSGSSVPQIKVTLLTGKSVPEDMVDKVNMPKGDSVAEGTKVGEITSPELSGYVFEGWYYDVNCTEYAYPNDVIEDGVSLYASFTNRRITGDEDDLNGNYTATMDLKDPNFKFRVTTVPPVPDIDVSSDGLGSDKQLFTLEVINYTEDELKEKIVVRDQYDNVELNTVITKLDNNIYEIVPADGFEPGKVYQLDISGADDLYIIAEGETLDKNVIYHNMSLYREESIDFKLEDNIIYIPADNVENLGELQPLMTAEVVNLSDTADKMTELEKAIADGTKDSLQTHEDSSVEKEGSFVYKASPDMLPKVGDTVCIYRGTSPGEKVEKSEDLFTEDDASYMVIDRIEDLYTFYYHLADPMDVVDVPTVVPISNKADLEPNDGNQITLPYDSFTFASQKQIPFLLNYTAVTYGEMEIDEETEVEVGDFLSIYNVVNGNVSEEDINTPKIVKITNISTKNTGSEGKEQIVVSYSNSSMDELQNQLQVHAKNEYDVPQSFIDEHEEEVSHLAAAEFEKADKTPLLEGLFKEEEVKAELEKNGVDISTTFIVDDNGNLLNADMLDFDELDLDFSSDEKLLDASNKNDKVKAELKRLSFEPDVYRDLTHFKRSGVGFSAEVRGQVEVSIDKFTFSKKIKEESKREGSGKIVIDFSLGVTQEIYINQNVDFDIVWKYYVIPVDLKANISIDVGSWSNVKGNLKVSTGYEDDAVDMSEIELSDSMKKYEDSLKKLNENIIPKLKDAKEAWEWDNETGQNEYVPWEADEKSIVDHIKDEDEDPVPQAANLSDFEKAYKNIVDGVSDTWMPLIKTVLVESKASIKKIVEFKLEIGFTLSFCGTIEIGAEFNYDYIKRYSASFRLRDFDVSTNTTDIQKPHSTFSLYAIGVFGLKPALYVEFSVGLISTDLDSVSVMVEAGFELTLYLYGILNIDNWLDESVRFQGGVFFDIKFVLEISLGAQVGKGAFSTSKTIYSLEIPLISLGTRYQIRGFAEDTGEVDEDDNPLYNMKDSMEQSVTIKSDTGEYVDIPKEYRMIMALDMRSGDVVPYIPEANEFKYEFLGDPEPVIPSPDEQNRGVLGKGVVKGFQSRGEKYPDSKIFLDKEKQDFKKVKSYERVLLDDSKNHTMIKFTIDVKMTYIPPGGVLLRGRNYTKILHITVDQTSRAKTIGYQTNIYKPIEGTLYNNTDDVAINYYMPQVPITDEDDPILRTEPHFVGYDFIDWQGLSQGTELYQYYDLEERYNFAGFRTLIWVCHDAYRSVWEKADDDFVSDSIRPGKEDPQNCLYNNIRFGVIAEPKQQKLNVRHWLIKPDGSGYELVSEDGAFTNENIVSDASYDMKQLYEWGVFDSLSDKDKAEVLRNYHGRKWEGYSINLIEVGDVKVTKGNGTTLTLTKKNGLSASVTPSDDECAVDTIDVYFTQRTPYNINYIAVDENGETLRDNSIAFSEYRDVFINGSTCKLRTPAEINTELTGYEFCGWNDISEFSELAEAEGSTTDSELRIMPSHPITVTYKVKPIEFTAGFNYFCDECKTNIMNRNFKTIGGEIVTLEEILNRPSLYDGVTLGNTITDDRDIVSDLAQEYVMGGIRGKCIASIDIYLSESKDRPKDLNIRVEFTEAVNKKMYTENAADYKDYMYASLDLGTDVKCHEYLGWKESDTDPFPKGYHFLGFRCNAESGPYPDLDTDYFVPVFMKSHLSNTDWTRYDEDTNTLTYIFRSELVPMDRMYTINHLYIDEKGFRTNYDKEVRTGYADQVVDVFNDHYYEVVGFETDYEKTPETFTVLPEGETVFDYYLKPAYYKYNFTAKDPETGEVIFSSNTYSKAAHDTFVLPEELRVKNNSDLDLEGYKFLGWVNKENGEWVAQDYYQNGTPSQVLMKIKVSKYTEGTFEAVYEKKDAKVSLYWDDYNSMRINDSIFKSKTNEYDAETGWTKGAAVGTVKTHTEFTLPEPKMIDGAVFLGWYDNPEFNGEPVDSKQKIKKDSVYYARVIHAFNVEFVGQGDADDPCDYSRTVKQSYGQPYSLPQYAPTRSHYSFAGWSTDPNGTDLITETSKASDEIETLYAVWGPAEYIISFDLDGGTWSEKNEIKHKYGVDTTTIPDEKPVKTGYEFVGWQRSGKTEILQADEISFEPKSLNWSITLFAVWTPVEYKIEYDTDGGTMPSSYNAKTWTLDTPVTIDPVPEKEDAVFKGWYESDEQGENNVRVREIDSKHKVGDITLHAKWIYKEHPVNVFYYSSTGENISYILVLDEDIPRSYKITDENYPLPDMPDGDVWDFDHWEIIDSEGKKNIVTELNFAEYPEKIELHAVFNKLTYSINYDFNGGDKGTETYPSVASIGETVKTPIPERSGYYFKGWTMNGTQTVSNRFEMNIAEPITLKAIWKNEQGYSSESESTYQVKYYVYDSSKGWMLDKTGTEQKTHQPSISYSSINNEYTFDKNLYMFDHISIKGDNTKFGYLDEINLRTDTLNEFNVYYSFKEYNVHFMYEHGSENEYKTEKLHYNEKITDPDGKPVKNGYTFNGWDYKFDTSKTVLEIFKNSHDLYIYPKDWTETRYPITYVNWPEGASNPNRQYYTVNDSDFALILPSKPGYTAKEQIVEINGKKEPVTVTVEWEKNHYAIAYDLQGGKVEADLLSDYTILTKVQQLPVPVKEGYSFTGWTIGDSDVKTETVPRTDQRVSYKLKANWVPKIYDITYNLNGGTPSEEIEGTFPETYSYDDVQNNKYAVLKYMEKEGYIFTGWDVYILQTGEHRHIGNTGMLRYPQPGSELYITAQFSLTNCTINYDMNAGSDVTNNPNYITSFYPSKTDELVIYSPERSGYEFEGWTCDKQIGSYKAGELIPALIIDSSNVVPEFTLTANWKAKPYYITYRLNGGSLTTTNKIKTTKNELGTLVPEASEVMNPSVYSIVNTFNMTDPSRKDNIKFLGWTSEQFYDLLTFTECELNESDKNAVYTKQPLSTKGLTALLNAKPKANYAPHFENLRAAGIILNAVWADGEYKLFYNLNGGELPDGKTNPESYTNISDTFTLVNPVRNGFSFLGWKYDNSDKLKTSVSVEKGSYGEKYFEAVWGTEKYSVEYDLNGGTVSGSSITTEYTADDLLISFGMPVRSNSVFAGWTVKNADDDNIVYSKITGNVITVDKENLCNLLVIANWNSEKGTINADPMDGEWASDAVSAGPTLLYPLDKGAVILLSDPVKKGYDFIGWNVPDGSGIEITAAEKNGCHNIVIPANTEKSYYDLSAIWEANSDTEYKVLCYTKEALDENYVYNCTKTYTGTAWTTVSDEVKDEFDSLVDDAELKQIAVNDMIVDFDDEIVINAEQTTEIKLYFEKNQHTVKFKDHTDLGFYKGQKITKPEDPEKTGYLFEGWYIDDEFKKPFDFENSVMGTEDITLYPNWIANGYEIEYKNWPEEIENPNPKYYITGTENFLVKYPELDPEKTGYDYGVLTDDDMKNRDNVNTYSGTGKISVNTPWNIHNFTIAYDIPSEIICSKEGNDAVSYNFKQEVNLPVLTSSTHNFIRWNVKKSSDGSPVTLVNNKIPEGTKGNLILTPVFEIKTFNIFYYGLAGSSFAKKNPNPKIYTAETEKFMLENPEKDGYDFKGWSDDGFSSNKTYEVNTQAGSDMTFTACWDAIVYNIKIDGEVRIQYSIEDISRIGVVLDPELYAQPEFGYEFAGWTVKDSNDNEIVLDEGYKLPEGTIGDLTVVSNFKEITRSIKYELQNGMMDENGSYPDTYKLTTGTVISDPVRKGYIFTGWNMNEEYGTSLYESKIPAGDYGDIVLYASWSEDTDTNVNILGSNDMKISGGKFDVGSTITLDSLKDLLPENFTFEDVFYNFDQSFSDTDEITVEEGEIYNFTVVEKYADVTLTATDGTNEMIALFIGAEKYKAGDYANISVSNIEGYNFEGWYSDVELNDLVTTENYYDFIATDNITYYAKFSIINYEISVMTSNGSKYYVNNGEVLKSGGVETIPYGSEITLTAADKESFIKWTDGEGKVLGNEPELKLQGLHNMSVTLISKADESQNMSYVEFYGPSDQVLYSGFYQAGDTFENYPAIPAKYGYSFKYWSVDEENKLTNIESLFGTEERIAVKPVYEKNDLGTYSVYVTINNEQDTKQSKESVPAGEYISLTAPETIDGKTFRYWSVENVIYSYNATCQIKPLSDVNINAYYDDDPDFDPELNENTVFITNFITENAGTEDNQIPKIAVAVVRDISDKYSIIESGVLYYNDGTFGNDDNMTVFDENVMRYIGINKNNQGTLILHFDMTDKKDNTVYARGYVTVLDESSGEIKTFYSEVSYGYYM